ncbi:efflux RND transporter periplasmic adaptor subunit [bacterium]|jgi:membrane fusion protein, multidrug efflux system|nr:efflux RND transporter periplasmic adaptor subunit [Verrucomicrobiota bacterium]MDA7680285.1 efflux RND transporter periplasmic adaptor subunit [bacterium]
MRLELFENNIGDSFGLPIHQIPSSSGDVEEWGCDYFAGFRLGVFFMISGMYPWRRVLGYCFIVCLVALNLPVHSDDAKPVVVAPVVLGESGELLRVTGTVFSRRYSKISSEVEGLVQTLIVDRGSYVKRGDVLCEIDATFAELDSIDAGYRLQRSKAALTEAKRQLDESTRLSQEKIVAESDLLSLRSQLRIAELEVERMEILETRAKETLDRYAVTAPFDGMVVSKQTEEGEWIDRGGTALTIVELDVVFVEFLVPQSFYNLIDRQRNVAVRFEALPNQRFLGKIHGVIALASESSRSFPVRIELSNPDHAIAPGMSARGVFQSVSAGDDQAILVPTDALVRTPNGRHSVWVVSDLKADSTVAVERVIELGPRKENQFVVASGDLKPGEFVVVRGNERLASGESVRVVERLSEFGNQ